MDNHRHECSECPPVCFFVKSLVGLAEQTSNFHGITCFRLYLGSKLKLGFIEAKLELRL